MDKPRNTLKPHTQPGAKPRRKLTFKLWSQKPGDNSTAAKTHKRERIFSRDNLIRQIPFILYLTILAILYIANAYNAEKTIIDISRTKRQLEEIRYSYITTKSELMFNSKQSEVANKLKNSGIKESLVPPRKIYIKQSK